MRLVFFFCENATFRDAAAEHATALRFVRVAQHFVDEASCSILHDLVVGRPPGAAFDTTGLRHVFEHGAEQANP